MASPCGIVVTMIVVPPPRLAMVVNGFMATLPPADQYAE